MTDLSIGTLLMALQAVAHEVTRLRKLVKSETLKDGADVQELLIAYEDSLTELSGRYASLQRFSKNHPPLDEILEQATGSS